MADLIVGTNCGFVTTAPTTDPEGSINLTVDNYASASKYTSPPLATTITEIGWWCDFATDETNFEVGIYADNAGVPGALLFSDTTNAKGTTQGYKTVSVNWNISGNTNYWLALQVDETPTQTIIHRLISGGDGYDNIFNVTTLPDPFNGGALTDSDGLLGIYAVVTIANLGINIADNWKGMKSMKINIGDVWKTVTGLQINIGDVWKTVF